MNKFAWIALCALLSSNASQAHEFWIQATSFTPPVNRPLDLTLHVGENFVGDLVGVTALHAASFKVHSKRGVEDLGSRLPRGPGLAALPLALTHPGTHVLAYQSHPSEVVLEADKFHEYLRMEGLEAIVQQRVAAGTAAAPGRERFRRSAKALLRAGNSADGTFAVRTGQRMEIVPLADPLSGKAGEPLRFLLAFDGKPLPGALLKAWHRRGPAAVTVSARSDAQGHAALSLPHGGPWLLNVVHMIPAVGVPNLDWDSFWGSLTFEIPSRN